MGQLFSFCCLAVNETNQMVLTDLYFVWDISELLCEGTNLFHLTLEKSSSFVCLFDVRGSDGWQRAQSKNGSPPDLIWFWGWLVEGVEMNWGGNMKVVLWYFVKMLFSSRALPELGKKINDLSTLLSRSQSRNRLLTGKGCMPCDQVFSSMAIPGKNRVDLKDFQRSVEQICFVKKITH